MTKFSVSVKVDAPTEKVWEVLADLGSIYKWNPGVAHSHSTSDAPGGEGATRHCDIQNGKIKMGYLEERAFNWCEGEGYTIDIYASTMPMKSSIVGFDIRPDGDGTIVTVTPEYNMKFGPLGLIMDTLMGRRMFKKGMRGLLAGLKYHVETSETINTSVPEIAA